MATLSLLADVALARLPIDARLVRCRAALASIPAFVAFLPLLAGAGCARPGGDDAPGAAGSASAQGAGSSWSREALAPRGGAADPVVPAVMGSIDPGALDDLIAAAPKPAASSGGAGVTPAIGADTGLPAGSATAFEPPPPEPKRSPRVVVGAPTMQPPMATPAIERAARAQLYWNLVQRCRDKDGKILPADAISLRFIVDNDGYITPSSIVARPSAAEHADAAHCMRRELSTATFRAPAATWGHVGEVRATVPSVD